MKNRQDAEYLRRLRDRCPYCGDRHHPDLGCSFCGDLQRARFDIERQHPGTGRPHQNLVKLAGHLAAGLHKGFLTAHGRGQFDPTQTELDQATIWAVEQFVGTRYILRDHPNGSMTELEKDNTC
jgi:hypothetical protein